jgi:hypothetical protein
MKEVRVKKLSLDLDELAVESFDPSPSLHNQRGTVKGQSGFYETCWSCDDPACGHPTWDTCYETCYTCDTCAMSCADYTCNTCHFTCNTCDFTCEDCAASGYCSWYCNE